MIDFDRYAKAIQLYELGRYDKALDILVVLLEQYPENTMIYGLMSHCYGAKGDYQSAKQIAKTGLEYDAEDDGLHYALAMAYSGLDDSTNAIVHLNASIEINPHYVKYYNQLAYIYAQKKYIAKAIKVLEIGLAIDPTDATALGLLSQIHFDHIDKKKGRALMEEALQNDPTSQLLLSLKADQSLKDDKFEDATFLLEQTLMEDPSDWRTREALIDANLSKNIFYRWVVMKMSGLKYANYTVIFLDLFVVVFGGLAMRQKHAESDYYSFWFYLISILVTFRFIVWITRFIGHLLYSKSNWKLGWKEQLSINNHLMLSMVLGTLSFLLYAFRGIDFFWLATSICIIVFAIISMGLVIIEIEKKQTYFKYYLYLIYGIGALNFLANFFNWTTSKFFVNAMMFVVFVPMVLSSIVSTIREVLLERSKTREDILVDASFKEKTTWLEHVVNWAIVPQFLIIQFGGLLYMSNVVQLLRFILIWGGLGIIVAIVGYGYLRSNNNRVVKYLVDHETTEESYSRILRVIVEMILAVAIFGMIITVFVPYGSTSDHVVEITQHGRDQVKDRVYMKVLLDGDEIKVRPPKDIRQNTSLGDSIVITTRKTWAGVDYVSDFSLYPLGK